MHQPFRRSPGDGRQISHGRDSKGQPDGIDVSRVARRLPPIAVASEASQALRHEAEGLLADHRLRSAKELRHYHDRLKALQRALRSEEFGQKLQASDPLLMRLQHRITHTETLLRSSSFNVCRTLEERAL
ncbi:MAG: hypothetical protein ACOVK6_08935, partial [Ramlibacter sp.]